MLRSLVVEDEPTAALALRAGLERAGHEGRQAAPGQRGAVFEPLHGLFKGKE